MMNGMMFGGEGPVMQGTWYNPNTGDAFTVRDSFFEDNQYVVTTTDGRYLSYNQIQNYIQSDMPLDQLKKQAKLQNDKEEIPAELKGLIATDDDGLESMMSPEDAALISGNRSLGNINDRHLAPAAEHQIKPTMTQSTPADMNYAIIEKALKNASKPSINVNIDWTNYPTKQIDMLTDVMDISIDEIVMWYLNNIQMDDVVDAVKEGVKTKLLCGEAPMDLTHLVQVQQEAEEVIESYSTNASTITTSDRSDKKTATVKAPKVTKSKPKKA